MHICLTVAGEMVQIISGLHGGHAVSQKVDLLKHLERQEDFMITSSTFQGLYGAQLSREVWRFQLMLDTQELLTRWAKAESTYGIKLSDYIKEVRNDNTEFEVPLVVAELGKEESRVGSELRCFRWAIPEVKVGKEHTLPESIYNEGFRCLMTLRSSTQHEGGIMGECGPELQRKEQQRPSKTTPTRSRKHNPLLCCCGCEQNASQSSQFCAKTQLRIMAWCAAAGGEEGFGSTSICKTCAKVP